MNELIIIESKIYSWINTSSLHKHPATVYKIEISEQKYNWIKPLKELNIKMNKQTRIEFCYISSGIISALKFFQFQNFGKE